MRINSTWRWLAAPSTHCTTCRTRLVPYLPACTSCQTKTPVQMQEVARRPHDLQKQADDVRVGHLSDLHIGHPPKDIASPLATFRIWIEHFQRHDVDVVVLSGDVVERPGDVFGMQQARTILEQCGMNWVVVPGNHDVKRPGYHDDFHDVFGRFPRLETYHGLHFILFDSMAGLPLEERDIAERMYGDYVCYTEGRVGAPQMMVAEKLLAKAGPGERVVVLHHHVMRQHADLMPRVPKRAGLTEDVLGTMKALLDADALFDWCKRFAISTIYHGHKHLYQQPGMREGNLLVLNAGSSTLSRKRQRARLIDHHPNGDKTLMNVGLHL